MALTVWYDCNGMFGLFSPLQFYHNRHVSPNILVWRKLYWSFSRKTVLVSIFPGSCDIQSGSQADLVPSTSCKPLFQSRVFDSVGETLWCLDFIKWCHGRNLGLLRKRKESKMLLLRTEEQLKGEMLEPAPHRHGFFWAISMRVRPQVPLGIHPSVCCSLAGLWQG